MEFKADSYGAGLKQVLHMTTGGKGIGSGAKYGDRTLVVWTDPAKGILICSAVNNKVSFCGPSSKYFKPLPAVGEWFKIEVGQEQVGSKMIYSISIEGTQRFSIENTHSAEFETEVSENSRSREFSTRVSFIFSRSTTRNDFLKSRSHLET